MSSGEASKDGGIDGTSRNTTHGLVSNLVSREVSSESAKDTSLISGVLITGGQSKGIALSSGSSLSVSGNESDDSKASHIYY